MKSFLVATLALSTLGGCVSAKVEESGCDVQSIAFPVPTLPTIPSEYASTTSCAAYSSFSTTVPAQSQTVTVNLSSTISKLEDVSSQLKVVINKLTLDNDQGIFDWVSSAEVDVSTSALPTPVELAHYTATSSGDPDALSFTVDMNSAQILNYLSSGPVVLTVTLEPSTLTACQVESLLSASSAGLESNVILCVDGSGTFSKSL